MATIVYDFSPNEVVWHITNLCGIKKATVLRVDVEIKPYETIINYRLVYEDTREIVVATDRLYAEADLATAIVDYQAMLMV